MSHNRSAKSPYQSRFGGGWISPTQYLAEGMCDRAARAGGETLPDFFWRDKRWGAKFVLQSKFATELLQKYSIEAIIEALKQPEGKRVYSLGLKSVLIPLIELEQKKIDSQQRQKLVIQPVDTFKKPITAFGKKTTLQKLKDLENG